MIAVETIQTSEKSVTVKSTSRMTIYGEKPAIRGNAVFIAKKYARAKSARVNKVTLTVIAVQNTSLRSYQFTLIIMVCLNRPSISSDRLPLHSPSARMPSSFLRER